MKKGLHHKKGVAEESVRHVQVSHDMSLPRHLWRGRQARLTERPPALLPGERARPGLILLRLLLCLLLREKFLLLKLPGVPGGSDTQPRDDLRWLRFRIPLYSTNIYYCMGTVEPYRTVLYCTVGCGWSVSVHFSARPHTYR